MSFWECMGAIERSLGRSLKPGEFKPLYDRMLEEKDNLFRKGYPDDFLAASKSVAMQIETEKKLAQRNVILNRQVDGAFWAFMGPARAQVGAAKALRAYLVGILAPIAGGRDSVSIRQDGYRDVARGAFLADLLKQADGGDRLVKLFATPGYALEIARALRGEAAPADAVKIAQAMERSREDLRRRENEAGGWRGKLEGFVTHQSHDSLKVRAAQFEQWKADILPRLDEKTFDRDADIKEQIRLERGKVLEHRLAAREHLMELQKSLDITGDMERKALARGRRYDRQVLEARGELNTALNTLLGMVDRPPSPEKAAARMAVEQARAKIQTLASKATSSRTMIPDLIEQWNETVGTMDGVSRAIETLDELDQKLKLYEGRQREAVDPDAFLKRIFNAIVADTWRKPEDDATREFSGVLKYIGPANMANRRATHRTLHFKSAEDEIWYMRKYGVGNLADSFMREIESAASAIALFQKLGPNPRAMWEKWLGQLTLEARDTGNHVLAQQVKDPKLDWYMAQVMGDTKRVANPTIAAWSETVRMVQSMAKLGGAMLTSFGDIPAAVAELQYQGRGLLESYAEMFRGLVRGRPKGDQAIIADLLGVGFDSLIGGVLARMAGESSPVGWLARSSQLFFRLNGLSWWTDAHKVTAGLVLSRDYALSRDKGWTNLDKYKQRTLAQYGIGPDDWDIIRQAAVQTADGKEFLTAEGIRQIPLGYLMRNVKDAIRAGGEGDMLAAERAARNWRDRLAESYGAMILDRVHFAVVTPGGFERAIMAQGTPRGDITGEALRTILQFKSFPIAMAYRALGRAFYGGEGGKLGAAAQMAFMATQLAIFGYLSGAAKDLLQGKNPRDPTDPKTIAAAFAMGGGLGIYGDFFFGEFNKYGRGLAETAAGPTVGTLAQLATLWSDAKDTDLLGSGRYGQRVAADGLRLMASNTPYASLWWLRPALNYLAIYPAQEMLSPGYMRRMEKRIERDQKQTFWLPPSQVSP